MTAFNNNCDISGDLLIFRTRLWTIYPNR